MVTTGKALRLAAVLVACMLTARNTAWLDGCQHNLQQKKYAGDFCDSVKADTVIDSPEKVAATDRPGLLHVWSKYSKLRAQRLMLLAIKQEL